MEQNLEILIDHFPKLDRRRLVSMHKGMKYHIFIYDNRRIFKFSRYEHFLPHLKNEIKLVNYIRPHFAFGLPGFDIIRNGFASYQLIKGIPLSQFLLTPYSLQDRHKILKSLAEFLKNLHSIPFFEEDDLPDAIPFRSGEDWALLFKEIESTLIPAASPSVRSWLEDLLYWVDYHRHELEISPNRKRLIHGDLANHHILLSEDGNDIGSIIDFGFAGIGDPAVDIGAVISQLGEACLDEMLPYYPRMQEHIFRARLWSLSTPLWWAIEGVKTGNKAWFADGLAIARDVRLS